MSEITLKEFWHCANGVWTFNKRTAAQFFDPTGHVLWLSRNSIGKVSALILDPQKQTRHHEPELVGHFGTAEKAIMPLFNRLSRQPRRKSIDYSLERFAERDVQLISEYQQKMKTRYGANPLCRLMYTNGGFIWKTTSSENELPHEWLYIPLLEEVVQ